MTDEEYLIKLGKKIAEIRKEKGWTQVVLAKKMRIHRTGLTRIELGKVNSTINVLRLITKVLGISLEDLFKGL